MNTPELIEHIRQRVVVIATLNTVEHILWLQDDDLICVETKDGHDEISPDDLLSTFPDAQWTITDVPAIKVDPETGYLLCPKCGSVMTARFNVCAAHIAFIGQECKENQVAYDHDAAEQDLEADVEEISCNRCDYGAAAGHFALDRAEFDAKHPAEEWKA